MVELSEAINAVQRISGMPGFPFEDAAQYELAKALRQSCEDTYALNSAIEDFLGWDRCPSVADIRHTSAPEKAWTPTGSRACPYGKCNGDGWICYFTLHTRKYGKAGGTYTEKQFITEEQYKDLVNKIDWQTQALYDGVGRCACNPGAQGE